MKNTMIDYENSSLIKIFLSLKQLGFCISLIRQTLSDELQNNENQLHTAARTASAQFKNFKVCDLQVPPDKLVS